MPIPPQRIAGLVLAAGAAARFGGPKLLAELDGRPLLEHVLVTARSAGLDPVVVVLGEAAPAIEPAIAWSAERRIRNPDPGRGLSSSLRIGIEALAADAPPVEAAIVLLGDQPRTDPAIIARLIAKHRETPGPRGALIAPRYAGDGASNPVLVRRDAFDLARSATGDRGLGPLIAAHPELVTRIDLPGTNPDVDTRADLLELGRARG